jgi:hypothetical protein
VFLQLARFFLQLYYLKWVGGGDIFFKNKKIVFKLGVEFDS